MNGYGLTSRMESNRPIDNRLGKVKSIETVSFESLLLRSKAQLRSARGCMDKFDDDRFVLSHVGVFNFH